MPHHLRSSAGTRTERSRTVTNTLGNGVAQWSREVGSIHRACERWNPCCSACPAWSCRSPSKAVERIVQGDIRIGDLRIPFACAVDGEIIHQRDLLHLRTDTRTSAQRCILRTGPHRPPGGSLKARNTSPCPSAIAATMITARKKKVIYKYIVQSVRSEVTRGSFQSVVRSSGRRVGG
jgi:hypothetical protein